MSRSKVSFFLFVSVSFAGRVPVRKTNNIAANGMLCFMMKLSGVLFAPAGGRLVCEELPCYMVIFVEMSRYCKKQFSKGFVILHSTTIQNHAVGSISAD